MRVKIQEGDKILIDLATDKSTVTIGRGSECDIRILNQNISRSHLAIKQEDGKVYISNISSSNWVLFNEEKINPNEWSEYSNTHGLELPGEIEVSVSLETSIKEETDNEPTNSFNFDPELSGDLELIRKKKKRNHKIHTPRSEEKESNKGQTLLFILTVIGLLLYINRDLFLN